MMRRPVLALVAALAALAPVTPARAQDSTARPKLGLAIGATWARDADALGGFRLRGAFVWQQVPRGLAIELHAGLLAPFPGFRDYQDLRAGERPLRDQWAAGASLRLTVPWLEIHVLAGGTAYGPLDRKNTGSTTRAGLDLAVRFPVKLHRDAPYVEVGYGHLVDVGTGADFWTLVVGTEL